MAYWRVVQFKGFEVFCRVKDGSFSVEELVALVPSPVVQAPLVVEVTDLGSSWNVNGRRELVSGRIFIQTSPNPARFASTLLPVRSTMYELAGFAAVPD